MITQPLFPILLASGEGPFDPASVAGYAIDYDPATFGLADGAGVTSLPDSSGNARHASTLVGSGPTYTLADADFGGKPSVVFPGTGKFRTSSFGPFATYTVFLVYSQTIGSGFNIVFDGATADRHETYPDGSPKWNSEAVYAGVQMLYQHSVYPLPPVVRTYVFNGASSKYLKDGYLEMSGNTGSNTMAGLTVGGYGAAGNYLTGKVARMIVYDGVPSDADQAAIVDYLHGLYGLPSPYSRKQLWGQYAGGLGCSAWPSLLALSGGDLLCVYSDGTTAENSTDIVLRSARSTDGGAKWTRGGVCYTEPNNMLSPTNSLSELGSGRLLMPVVVFVGAVTGNPTVRVLYSDDAGLTWGVLASFFGAGSYTSSFTYGHVVRAGGSDADLRVAAYGRTAANARTSAFMLRSTDGGLTWALRGTMFAEDGTDSFSEAGLVDLGGGNWLAVARKDPATGTSSLWKATSSDGGVTWSAPAAIFAGKVGVAPHLLTLASGDVLLAAGHRAGDGGIFVGVSADGGATWGTPVTVYQSRAASPVGYASAEQLANGRIAVAMTGDPVDITVTLVQQFDESYFA